MVVDFYYRYNSSFLNLMNNHYLEMFAKLFNASR